VLRTFKNVRRDILVAKLRRVFRQRYRLVHALSSPVPRKMEPGGGPPVPMRLGHHDDYSVIFRAAATTSGGDLYNSET
jgi:hypothetical protein